MLTMVPESMTHSVVIVVILLSLSTVQGQIKILSPATLVSAIQSSSEGSDILVGATATFGAPAYGESFVGRMFNVPSASTYCSDDYGEAIQKMVNGTELESGLRKIFVIQRGGCTFVKKTSIAQRLGADAVIVVDLEGSPWSRKEMLTVIMADDGYGTTVNIPSVMVTKEDGKLLLDTLKAGTEVFAQLQWSLPQKSTVSLDFWTEAGSSLGQRFLKDYAYHANLLRGHLRFTPHYNVYGLKAGSSDDANRKLCLPVEPSLCSNPPDVLGFHVTGSDVLEEDARQLCLWEITAREVDGVTDSNYSLEWWEYVRKFADSCPIAPASGPRFGADCSYHVMSTIPGINLGAVRECKEKKTQTLLEREKANKAWSNLAVRINGAKFSGSLDPMQVSKAVCSAFEKPPAECVKLTGQAQTPLPGSTISASSVLMGLFIIATFGGVSLYFYQRYMRKSMRTALRHEVMLEVRSQLQEYHQLDEENDPTARQKRPLMMSP